MAVTAPLPPTEAEAVPATLEAVLAAAYEKHSHFTTSTAWNESPANEPKHIAPHCRGCGQRIGELEGYQEFFRTLVPGRGGYREGPKSQGLSAQGRAAQQAHIVQEQTAAVKAFLARS